MKLFLASSLDKTIALLLPRLGNQAKGSRVIFIANAADPYTDQWWVETDRQAFKNAGFELIETDLRKIDGVELRRQTQNAHILHICGGSVFYLLSLLKTKDLGAAIAEAVRENRIFYTGTSAGSIIVSKSLEIYKYDLEEAKFLKDTKDFSGLDLVDFLIVPHCNNKEFVESNKRLVEHAAEFPAPFILLQDSQAVWVDGGKLEIVSV